MKRLIPFTILALALLSIPGCKPKIASVIPTTLNLYVGTYTNGASQGIYLLKFDTITGQLKADTLVATLNNPSYLTVSANKKYVAAISEDDSRAARLFTFLINPVTGHLSPTSEVETGGFGPCYVSTLGDTIICTANYRSGSVCFAQTDENGKIADTPIQCFAHQGTGPNAQRQENPHAHSIIPDLDGKFVYSADLGADKVYVYRLQADSTVLAKEIAVPAGAGPRHIAFHPGKKLMAVVNELIPAVELYAKDDNGIFSQKTSSVSLLPDTVPDESTAADIHFSPDGKFVYATNRGFDFIATISVDEQNQTLQLIERNHGMLNWPRNFIIAPAGNFVLVANQKGNNIVVFTRDAQTGKLLDTGHRFEIDSPVCLKF
ncbi:MAG: lactonase family protein [Breznakibacter sp.]